MLTTQAIKVRMEIIEATKECMVSPEESIRDWAGIRP
jgi:hypothetical protein